MREILFRGKPKDKDYKLFNNWKERSKDGFVYGSLLTTKDTYYICISVLRDCNSFINNGITTMLEVIPETVSQYTGLTDKNGNKIFEGDIVKYSIGGHEFEYGEIIYRNVGFEIDGEPCDLCVCSENCSLEVIGNIFDNPELFDGTAYEQI